MSTEFRVPSRSASSTALMGALLGFWLLGGCGYRFTAGGAPLPEGIRHVFAPVFGNRTAEPAFEVVVTQAMREQLARAGVEGGADSEGRLEGEVVDLQSNNGFQQLTQTAPNGSLNISCSTPENPQPCYSAVPVYRVAVRVHLRLKKGASLVAETDVAGSEDYLSAQGDVLGTEANREAALRRLAQSLMQEGYNRFTSGF